MHRWLPSSIYESKPWLLIVVGALLVASMTVWSLSMGYWSVTRSLLTLLGAGLAIGGGAVLQLRQDYRAKSKWRRDRMP
ncbi:MAG TPA: hypothetical protein VGI93_03255 [Steroidobacteraceae bacterium]|jgi:protein-S-isoprenylcysteine O-methyltransferase Ste14